MASWTGEEVVEGLEHWLKLRRDELAAVDTRTTRLGAAVVDALLNEVRDNAVEGWLPWQRLSEGEN